jgi:hypothetical protein
VLNVKNMLKMTLFWIFEAPRVLQIPIPWVRWKAQDRGYHFGVFFRAFLPAAGAGRY